MSWKEQFERYKKPQEIESEPENFIHIGLNPACSYSDLIKDIETTLKQSLIEARDKVVGEVLEIIEEENKYCLLIERAKLKQNIFK